jgi:hypothetical protein
MSSSSSSSKVKIYADLDRARVTPGCESHCKLVVSCSARTPATASTATTPFVESIEVEWRGIERLDPVWIKPTQTQTQTQTNGNSNMNKLKAGERFIARSPPGVVLSDVKLEANERHVLKFAIQLPPGLPPTYKGQFCRYYYYVIFVCKVRGEREPIVIEMPLRVYAGAKPLSAAMRPKDLRMNNENKQKSKFSSTGETNSNNSGPITPRGILPSWSDGNGENYNLSSSSFQMKQATLQEEADESLRDFLELARMKKPQQRTYAITSENKFVCKITPANPLPVIACGELISGVFDFENTRVETMETMRVQSYSWSLETEEIALNSGAGVDGADNDSKIPVLRKIWAEGSERSVENIRRTFFSVSVPLDAPGSFRTTKVELVWVIKFSFQSGAEKVEWRYPIEVLSRSFAKKSGAFDHL